MTNPMQTTAWSDRRAGLMAADGDEWDRLSEAFDADWKAAYVAEFVLFALSRGWTGGDAREWADEIKAEAMIHGEDDPIQQARIDVPECELESTNAG